jgi:hypothetical protein
MTKRVSYQTGSDGYSAEEWDRPYGQAARGANNGYGNGYTTYTSVNETCPVCGRKLKEVSFRGLTIVGCSATTTAECDFELTARSTWEWNRAIRALKTAAPKFLAPKPVAPRLVIRLDALDKVVRMQVVEQNLRGFDFNEEVRIKGLQNALVSNQAPDISKTMLSVRGSDKDKDDAIVSVTFGAKDEADSAYDEIMAAVWAFNDNSTSSVLDFPEAEKKEVKKDK